MLPAGSLEAEELRFQATSWVHYTISCNTQSSAAEDGRDQRPKHVELIGIINKPLLLYLVGVYIIYNTGCVHVQAYKEDHGPESRSVLYTGDYGRRSQLVVDSVVSGRCVQHTDKFVHSTLS